MSIDRLIFGVMYRVGFTPWEGHVLPDRLRGLIEGPEALQKGTALDLGCGTGLTAIYLAQHGWSVTAVDFVEKPLAKARARSEAANVSVRFLRADVTKLGSEGIAGDFQLINDSGCLHGLSPDARDAYVREVTAIARPGTRLLILGFAEGNRRPRGFNRPEIEQRFQRDWELLASGQDLTASNDPKEPIYFYDLKRR